MIERPASAPREGQIEAFDAGWNAHETGLGRQTVEVVTPPTGQGWALLAWDMREALSRKTDCPACGGFGQVSWLDDDDYTVWGPCPRCS